MNTLTEMDCLRMLEPLATPETRRYIFEAERRVKNGERNVTIKRLEIKPT